jgi:hypothetical protein
VFGKHAETNPINNENMNATTSPYIITAMICKFPAAANPYAPVVFYTDMTGKITTGVFAQASTTGLQWPIFQNGAPPANSSFLQISTPYGQYQIYYNTGDGVSIAPMVVLQTVTNPNYPSNQRVLWTGPIAPPVQNTKFTLAIDAANWSAQNDGISLSVC